MSLRFERFIPPEPMPTVSSKDAEREQLATEIEEYIARGGEITVVDEPTPLPKFRIDRDGRPRYVDGNPFGRTRNNFRGSRNG